MNRINWLICLVTAVPICAQTFNTLVSFDQVSAGPFYMSLVQGFDGSS
jgi:hypothetical protein